MKISRKLNWYIVLPFATIFLCGFFVFLNSVLYHYLFAVVEAPSCTSRIMEKINRDASYKSVDEYIEANIRLGMSRKDVHDVFENISPISVNKSGNLEEIVLLMCYESLNNLVYSAEYSSENVLIHIEYEDFP